MFSSSCELYKKEYIICIIKLKKMKNLAYLLVFSVIVLSASFVVNAQESETVSEGEGIEDSVNGELDQTGGTTEETSETSEVFDEDSSEGLSEEEILDLVEDLRVLGEDDIESLEELEGEIISITDVGVIIENQEGEIILVDTDAYEKKLSRWRGDSVKIRKPQLGDKIETGTVSIMDDKTVVTTDKGVYVVSGNTQIQRNGKSAQIKDVQDGDTAMALLDAEGNIVGLDVTGEMEESSSNILLWSAITLIVVIIGLLFTRRKPKDEIMTE